MKILFIGSAISNHTLRWVNSLSERGHNVLLVCGGDLKAKSENIKISDKVKVHYLRFGSGIGYYLNAVELNKIYKDFKPDIVNAHYATGHGVLARLARVKPLIISFWGSDIFEYPFLSRINRRILLKNILYADAVAATSIAMAKKIKEVYPEYKKDVVVTPFGIDTELFKPKEREKNKRSVIGIVKYLKPIYDIPLLIDAFSILWHKMDVKPLLYIYGGGPLLEELQEKCDKLGISEDVIFFGTIPNTQIAEAINNMDVFVNCSKAESFGVALLEAMACKVPVVATDTEGYREVVQDGVTGIILKDRKPETMAEELLRLLNNQEVCNYYGENGRKRVLELYDWNKDVSIMESLYEETVRKKGI
ncbi:MAG: glycosyltransferase [Lachnospiraceae bacterium]|nr:glycosyltransferase [Lachnospiraceae bacterium]